MKAGWLVAIAAGAAIGVSAPAELEAQGNSNRARQQQEAQRQRERAREQTQRRADRERVRERERLPAGIVLRRNDRDREYDRRHERNRRDDRYDRYDDRYDRDQQWRVYESRDERYDRYDRDRRRGPAFCRSGEGHPVHGRQWCRQKGFALGNERSRDIWGDIIYRDRRYDDRRMDHSTLGDILGSVVLGRFDSYGREYYGSGSLNGRWLDNRSTTLQLFMGSTPIARLIDSNRDGRVDSVSLMR